MSSDPLARARALYFDLRRKNLAEDEARQALAADPNYTEANVILALCLASRKEFAAALEAAQAAIRSAPDHGWPHYAAGWVWLEQGSTAEAEEAFRTAVSLEPTRAPYWELLAEVVRLQRWPDEALELAGRGLEQDAGHVGCLIARAAALIDLDRPADAVTDLSAALAHDASSARAHAFLGLARLNQVNPRAAIDHFQTALSLDSDIDWCRDRLTEAAEMLARWPALKLLMAVQVSLAIIAPLTINLVSASSARQVCVRAWLLAAAVSVPVTFVVTATPGVSAWLLNFSGLEHLTLTRSLARSRISAAGGCVFAVAVAGWVFAETGGSVSGCSAALGLAVVLSMAPAAVYAGGCTWPWQPPRATLPRSHWFAVAAFTMSLYPSNILALLWSNRTRPRPPRTLSESRRELRFWAFGATLFGLLLAPSGSDGPRVAGVVFGILLLLLQAKILRELAPRPPGK
jgi:Tfp pilus assembly protein PilF